MELLKRLGDSERNRAQRLRFLALFLKDETVRDEIAKAQQYDPLFGGRGYARLAVRDFAALKIATILEKDFDPNRIKGAEDFANLRARVRKELDSEGIKVSDW